MNLNNFFSDACFGSFQNQGPHFVQISKICSNMQDVKLNSKRPLKCCYKLLLEAGHKIISLKVVTHGTLFSEFFGNGKYS